MAIITRHVLLCLFCVVAIAGLVAAYRDTHVENSVTSSATLRVVNDHAFRKRHASPRMVLAGMHSIKDAPYPKSPRGLSSNTGESKPEPDSNEPSPTLQGNNTHSTLVQISTLIFATQLRGVFANVTQLDTFCQLILKPDRMEAMGLDSGGIQRYLCHNPDDEPIPADPEEIKRKTGQYIDAFWSMLALAATGPRNHTLCEIFDPLEMFKMGLNGTFIKGYMCGSAQAHLPPTNSTIGSLRPGNSTMSASSTQLPIPTDEC